MRSWAALPEVSMCEALDESTSLPGTVASQSGGSGREAGLSHETESGTLLFVRCQVNEPGSERSSEWRQSSVCGRKRRNPPGLPLGDDLTYRRRGYTAAYDPYETLGVLFCGAAQHDPSNDYARVSPLA
jgi:hypothetical protein